MSNLGREKPFVCCSIHLIAYFSRIKSFCFHIPVIAFKVLNNLSFQSLFCRASSSTTTHTSTKNTGWKRGTNIDASFKAVSWTLKARSRTQVVVVVVVVRARSLRGLGILKVRFPWLFLEPIGLLLIVAISVILLWAVPVVVSSVLFLLRTIPSTVVTVVASVIKTWGPSIVIVIHRSRGLLGGERSLSGGLNHCRRWFANRLKPLDWTVVDIIIVVVPPIGTTCRLTGLISRFQGPISSSTKRSRTRVTSVSSLPKNKTIKS